MKIYKIDSSKISEYTKRNDNRLFKAITIAIASLPFLMFLIMWDTPAEFIFIPLFSILLAALMLGLVYLNNKKLTRLTAENLQIIVDDNSIIRVIDLDNEPRLNFLHKITYDKAKNISSEYYAKVDFNNIKSIENKNGDLWVKGAD